MSNKKILHNEMRDLGQAVLKEKLGASCYKQYQDYIDQQEKIENSQVDFNAAKLNNKHINLSEKALLAYQVAGSIRMRQEFLEFEKDIRGVVFTHKYREIQLGEDLGFGELVMEIFDALDLVFDRIVKRERGTLEELKFKLNELVVSQK